MADGLVKHFPSHNKTYCIDLATQCWRRDTTTDMSSGIRHFMCTAAQGEGQLGAVLLLHTSHRLLLLSVAGGDADEAPRLVACRAGGRAAARAAALRPRQDGRARQRRGLQTQSAARRGRGEFSVTRLPLDAACSSKVIWHVF